MSQVAIVLAHAGAEGSEGGTVLTVGIVAVLVVVWAALAVVGWVFYVAKRRDEARAGSSPLGDARAEPGPVAATDATGDQPLPRRAGTGLTGPGRPVP